MSGTRPLKIGIQLPEVERVVPWTEMVRMARRAEELGFDSIWVGDHLLYRTPGEPSRGPWEAWSLLAALAAATERVEIGPLVACTAFHNPAVMAKKAATVDEISGGRLILGLGAGWNEAEFNAFGIPFDHRASRFREAFTIIRSLLRDGVANFQGAYYRVNDCELIPRGPRPGGIPLLIGSFGPRVLWAALPHADAWNAWYADFGNEIDAFVALNQRVNDICLAVGHDPRALERTAALLIGLSDARGRLAGSVDERAIAPITGSSDEIARQIQRFVDAGVSHVQLVLDPITIEGIEEVAPVLNHLDRRR